ncbi:MAG: YHS domain-containing (seleno)protein [Chryseolinea sp.]
MKTTMQFIFFVFCTLNSFCQTDPISTNGIAIGSFDPVSSFTTGHAVKGTDSYQTKINNISYLFSSAANQKLFEDNPTKYIPQYEGYCALAVSYGKKISNPETFKIIDGKLYLFYNKKVGLRKVNSLDTWNKSEARLLKKADELWPKVSTVKYVAGEDM